MKKMMLKVNQNPAEKKEDEERKLRENQDEKEEAGEAVKEKGQDLKEEKKYLEEVVAGIIETDVIETENAEKSVGVVKEELRGLAEIEKDVQREAVVTEVKEPDVIEPIEADAIEKIEAGVKEIVMGIVIETTVVIKLNVNVENIESVK